MQLLHNNFPASGGDDNRVIVIHRVVNRKNMFVVNSPHNIHMPEYLVLENNGNYAGKFLRYNGLRRELASEICALNWNYTIIFI